MAKEPDRTFEQNGKEPVINRIFQLVQLRYSSRSEAARVWGINVNTLNNYYKRSGQNPVPRKQQLQKIADCEGVSLEWLLTGEGHGPKSDERAKLNSSQDRLAEVLSFLTEEERSALAEVLARKGVEVALHLLDKDAIDLLKLSGDVRQAALMLDTLPEARVREILAECGEIQHDPRITVQHKAAG
ncbi:TPA: hypothetical protein LVL76_006005 [Klebsiella oxytoca]|uniref:hypothetical protein n=1 Tax=Klebsiella oxytoca TaxID=571 RepID=UPI000CC4F454|nr:hypothetical protein CWN68_09955 [Klebsiella michiganensis]HBM3102603.1 hypothetical protein [Klebsiella oxytoca]HBM3103652.1 hypothetical protein [Klebsiella oxytoca]HBM3248973.1 hypothetical protein [Klebsiella oxytoca]HDS9081003.1 hypothetical protein [Klebsiella oxytoca]